jgi:peroxiredoxin
MKIRYLIIIVIFLSITNLFFLFKNYYLKKHIKEDFDIMRKPYLMSESAPNFVLNDLNGVRYNFEEIFGNSPYTLLVFFSPLDCRPCLEEMNLWQRISEEGKVQVVGVARHIDKRELKNWVQNSDIIFPVLYDGESQVTKMFNIKKTPLKILIDSKGNILLVDKARVAPYDQIRFVKKLNKIINK